MRYFTIIIACLINITVAKSQPELNFLHVTPTVTASKAVATYSFSGTGTDTIGAYIIDMMFFVKATLRSDFVVSDGLYTDTLVLDNLPDNMYRFVLTRNLIPFASQRIHKSTPAGTETLEKDVVLKLYPNPVKDKLTIEYQDNMVIDKINITNALGQNVFITDVTETKQEIDISFLPVGIYYLKVQNKEEQRVFKIIKE